VSGPRPSHEPVLDETTSRSVIARIAKDEGVSSQTGERWFAELLKFLDLAAEMSANGDGRPLAPSLPVDAAWHSFVLHTRPYMEFCERRYGEYLHHEVTAPDASVGLGAVFEYLRTRVLMEERYGGLDEELWPLP
jgi:hypothetical protein